MNLSVVRRSLSADVTLMLLALVPVLAASDTLLRAAGLGAAIIVAVAVARAADRMLQAQLADAVRICASAVLASAAVALFGLVAAAYLPDLFADVQAPLPLAAASALLVSGALTLRDERSARRSYGVELACVVAAILVLVCLGAVRDGLAQGTELARHPAGAFLVAGLALAAARHWPSRRHSGDAGGAA